MEWLDSDDGIMREIRMKYAEDIEEILECPVCYEIPRGTIALCTKGHHTCMRCKNELMIRGECCPTCQNPFSNSSRNYIAERMCLKFEDIKSSILDPKHSSNRRVIKDVKSVLIQTDKKNVLSVSIQTDDEPKKKFTSTETQTDILKNDPNVINGNDSVISISTSESDTFQDFETSKSDEDASLDQETCEKKEICQ